VLRQVLAFDVDSAPRYRLANVLAQRRARALLGHVDDLFA
jgi:predicted anti-sigma-YlaC factor YlaD